MLLDITQAFFSLSGQGFKYAPVVGKVLGEMSLRKIPSYDITPFMMKRFLKKSTTPI